MKNLFSVVSESFDAKINENSEVKEILLFLKSKGWVSDSENPDVFDYEVTSSGIEVEDEDSRKRIARDLRSKGYDVKLSRNAIVVEALNSMLYESAIMTIDDLKNEIDVLFGENSLSRRSTNSFEIDAGKTKIPFEITSSGSIIYDDEDYDVDDFYEELVVISASNESLREYKPEHFPHELLHKFFLNEYKMSIQEIAKAYYASKGEVVSDVKLELIDKDFESLVTAKINKHDITEEQAKKVIAHLAEVPESSIVNLQKDGDAWNYKVQGSIEKRSIYSHAINYYLTFSNIESEQIDESGKVTDTFDISKMTADKIQKIEKIFKAHAIQYNVNSKTKEIEFDINDLDVEAEKALSKLVGVSVISEGKVTSDSDFKSYATNLLKRAHGDDFDEKIANDTIKGLIDKYGDDYGAMVGALTSSLS